MGSVEIGHQITKISNEKKRLQEIVDAINNECIDSTQKIMDSNLNVDSMNLTKKFTDPGYGYIGNIKNKLTQLQDAFVKVNEDIKTRTTAILSAKGLIEEKIKTLESNILTLQTEQKAAQIREKKEEEEKKAAEEKKKAAQENKS